MGSFATLNVNQDRSIGDTFDADLVVDASGRAAPTMALLDALGWDRPKVAEVDVNISYQQPW
ncbi:MULTISPECIES: hypothetical protein [Bradyrhizobium]|uniref:hypothetical protein n=1 Tax=Bradyrhizobium elkanii TaxID=29448 RepID=UPI000406CAC7|nr:hypothetical protein [Bradyrhizobium elkanii]